MKFSVGYQYTCETGESLAKELIPLKEHIEEVYFAWPDMPSGRSIINDDRGEKFFEAQSYLESDLKLLSENGIKLNLLLNASCFSDDAISMRLQNTVCSIISHIEEFAVLNSVTTTSPYLASVVKQYFPKIETRASINMRIGTKKGISYLSDLFDGFYLQREYNRDFEKIKEIKEFCNKNGKKLFMLANSGCMAFCSAQTFHDNALSHEREIAEKINKPNFEIARCFPYYKRPENRWELLTNTFVRPEEINLYEDYFDAVKLATRTATRPLYVIKSYINGACFGNLLDLLEPNHTKVLGENKYLSNQKIPKEWFSKGTSCNKDCYSCGYCKEVYDKILCEY